MKTMRQILMMAAVAAATTLGAVELDVSFVKGLLAIPSESRLIPECNRAVVYVKDYLGNGGLGPSVLRRTGRRMRPPGEC